MFSRNLLYMNVNPSLLHAAEWTWNLLPIGSMYGVCSYIYHQNQQHVGKYTIHGSWLI